MVTSQAFIAIIQRLLDDDYSSHKYKVEDLGYIDEYIDQRIDLAIGRFLRRNPALGGKRP